MAKRRVYFLAQNKVCFEDFEIKWYSGFSYSQKIKNVMELHRSISEKKSVTLDSILEVSTKSLNDLGKTLSSFNLFIEFEGRKYNVESAYQSSKVFNTLLGEKSFEKNLTKSPIEARSAIRDMDHHNLKEFRFKTLIFDLHPKYLFYDWLYITALTQKQEVYEKLSNYEYFTDIEFNPDKSLNCQARSIVLYIWLIKNNRIEEYLNNPGRFYKNL